MTDKTARPPLKLGTRIKPYGRIVAVGNGVSLGERYYWLIDKHGCVSMMPATEIERGRSDDL